ncbi:MAG: hypothetical protein PWQ96_1141 [Clostridia bacterium]|nr:hypothetical protein [Clostridia bacterium]
MIIKSKTKIGILILILIILVSITACSKSTEQATLAKENGELSSSDTVNDNGNAEANQSTEDLQDNSNGYDEKTQESQDLADEDKKKLSVSEMREIQDAFFRRDQGQAGVWVDTLWAADKYLELTGKNPQEFGTHDAISFVLFMTTHSGNLLDYNPVNNAELFVDGKSVQPLDWTLTSESTHHPVGILRFPRADIDGNSLITDETKELKLVLKNLRGVQERTFIWELPIEVDI